MALFENYESRIDHINEVLQSHGIESLEADMNYVNLMILIR